MRIYPHVNEPGHAAWFTMRSPAASPPLAVTVLAALCVGLNRCGASAVHGPPCDNGKVSLDRDLPADAAHWDCASSTWPQSTQLQTLPSIDSVYDPEPAREICMDKPISYHHSIPNSGAFRPVKAESGEYLYCPPQRWLNNLHHGAVVLLHHPCAPLRERHLLSGLARSCLPAYIMTSHPQLSRHMPLALVSWGRTLELGTVASPDICDWLQTTKTTRNASDGEAQTMMYNLLLIRSAGPDRLERSTIKQETLRRCCKETISSLLRGTVQSELHVKRRQLMHMKMGNKNRGKRAANGETEGKNNKRRNTLNVLDLLTNQTSKTTSQNHSSSLGADSVPEKQTFLDASFPRQTLPSEVQKQNENLTSWTINSLVSNGSKSTFNTGSVGLGASKSETNRLVVQTETLPPSHEDIDVRQAAASAGTGVFADGVNGKRISSAGREALAVASEDDGSNSVKQKDEDSAKRSKGKDEEAVDVEEREVEHEQTHVATHRPQKGGNTGFNPTSKSQSMSGPQQNPQPADRSHANSKDCDSCRAGERCDCTKTHAAAVHRGLPRTPRSDEAVWAAAALGFLLVLLTLSVLHTRLYRHWRTTPSLYWHDPRQDYDSVADVIRRRLRIAKRRRKRGQRQECVLLPSSSSSDEHP